MKRIVCIWLPEQGSGSGVQGSVVQDQGAAVPAAAKPPTGHRPLATDHWPLLEALADACARFSPSVGVEQSDAPESLLLDITGLAHLFGGEDALARQIAEEFARRGLTARIAIAGTIGAAWAVGHFGIGDLGLGIWDLDSAFRLPNSQSQIPNSKFQILLIPPNETLAALRPLPVAALRLPEDVLDLLHQLGIERIGQLEALPREGLSSRFGPELLRRWDQATGRLAEPVPARQPPPEFQARCSLEYPTSRQEFIAAALEQLIRRLATSLFACGRGAMRLECSLECPPGEPVRICVGLFQPTVTAAHLFQLALVQLERLRLRAPVSAVYVAAPATALLERRQQEMFSRGQQLPKRDPRHAALLIERLSSRLGRHSVVRPRLVADAQPELAWQYDPLVGGAAAKRRHRAAPAELPPRPLRLVPRPIPLAATAVMPDDVDPRSCLVQFQLHGRQHRVASSRGPERIETGWWRGQVAGRDYYRVATTAGRRFWLFRRLRDGKWFLHGMFD